MLGTGSKNANSTLSGLSFLLSQISICRSPEATTDTGDIFAVESIGGPFLNVFLLTNFTASLLWLLNLVVEMKGGNPCRFKGRKFFLCLMALIFSFVFLLMWERNPFLTTFISVTDQSLKPSSDAHVPSDPSALMIPKELIKEAYPSSADEETEHEETGRDKIVQVSDAVQTDSLIERSSKRDDGYASSSVEKASHVAACNYAKGKWVFEERRPLYSGFGCKQWLSGMWACRLTQRPDFSYEKYRWQPENCEMPEFEGSAFLKRMEDKTLVFVGDSLGRQQFQSLMCIITGGKEQPKVQDVGVEYGLVTAPGARRPDGWAYRFPITNTTIIYYWSASLCGIEPLNITDPATEFAMHLDRPPGFLSQFLHRFDVLVLNTGHHWNRGKVNENRWVMHVNGRPVEDRNLKMIHNAKNFAVHSVVRWLDSQLPLHPHMKAFFRTLSPRHFLHGDWNSGGTCNNVSPLARGSEVRNNESSDPVVEDAVKGTKVKILDITALSELRDEGHISHYRISGAKGGQDCLHWCLPGIPDTWNELLFAQI